MDVGINGLVRDLRESAGWSQGDLAELLREVSGRPTVTRDEVKRWESGKVIPGRFWLAYLAEVFQVPLSQLERAAKIARMNRRTMLAASGAALLSASPFADMLASVIGGDESWLSHHIGPYDFSMSLATVAASDRGTQRRLVRWLHEGSTSLLRGNAQGTLFKTRSPELIELAEQSMRHDEETRQRCMRCFTRRTFDLPWAEARTYHAYEAPEHEVGTLSTLLHDPADSSNRWCAAVYLGEAASAGSQTAHSALVGALRTETSRENLRAIGLSLSGERPWT